MADTTYTYSVANDFPGGVVNPTKLHAEILASAIATSLIGVRTTGDALGICFSDALSAGDKTILDGDASGPAGGSVAAHDNTATVIDTSPQSSDGASSTTQNTWDDKLIWTTPKLVGDYVLHYYAEATTGSAGETGEFRVRNVTDVLEVAIGTIQNDVATLGGHKKITFTGATKTIKIQWKADTSGKTMYIRRARLWLMRVN